VIYLRQKFYNPVCLCCSSFFVEEHLFCVDCYQEKIKPHIRLKKRNINFSNQKQTHFYLLDWIPGESDLLSRLVYAMKGEKAVFAIHFYAHLLLDELTLDSDFNSSANKYILPLAGSKKGSTHSLRLAKKIAAELGFEYFEIFDKEMNTLQQKQQSAKDRQQVSIKLKNDPSVIEQITQVSRASEKAIFVDDVLTTGNSFKQSKDLLNKKQEADIITLFYRSSAHETSLVVKS
jgi:predicted amidophosphoribosyltransferase